MSAASHSAGQPPRAASSGTILVTGATGQVGSAVCAALRERGVAWRSLVRSIEGRTPDALQTFVQGDLGRPLTLGPALDGIDKVFLSSRFEPGMADLEMNLVRAADASGVRQIVQLTGIGADPHSPVTTLRWLGEIEAAVAASRCNGMRLRAASFLQNLLALSPTVRSEDRFYTPLGNARLTYVDTRDIGDVAAAVLASDLYDDGTYVVTGETSATQDEIATAMTRSFGRPITHVPVSFDTAADALRATGMPPELVEALIGLWRDHANNAAPARTDTVSRMTGRPPRSLEGFLAENACLFASAGLGAKGS